MLRCCCLVTAGGDSLVAHPGLCLVAGLVWPHPAAAARSDPAAQLLLQRRDLHKQRTAHMRMPVSAQPVLQHHVHEVLKVCLVCASCSSGALGALALCASKTYVLRADCVRA